jgi:AraC family transcriptional regulator
MMLPCRICAVAEQITLKSAIDISVNLFLIINPFRKWIKTYATPDSFPNLPLNHSNVLLTTLPKPSEAGSPALPEVYSDHFLFYEDLRQPYHCPEHSSALGLLMSGKGSCDYFVNGARNRVLGNQLFLVNRRSRLAIHIDKKESAPALLFFNSRLPELVQHSLSNTDETLLENSTAHYYDFAYLERIHENLSLSQTLHTLVLLGSSCSSFASLKADIMIRNLFEQLLRENQQALQLSKNISAIRISTRLEIFKRVSFAREWIEANCCSRISLEQIAAVANMNSQHFLRMFKQVYHITPHQYVIGCKLEKAKQLLQSTQLTVAEICNTIGFESVYSFSLLFRRRFGVPPRTWVGHPPVRRCN